MRAPSMPDDPAVVRDIQPGELFAVPAGSCGAEAGWCVRLFGRSLTDLAPLFGFVRLDGHVELVYLSAVFVLGRCQAVGWESIPTEAASVLEDCLNFPLTEVYELTCGSWKPSPPDCSELVPSAGRPWIASFGVARLPSSFAVRFFRV